MWRKTVRNWIEVIEFMVEVDVYDEYGNVLMNEPVHIDLVDNEDYSATLDRTVIDFLIYRDRVALWVE